MTYSKKIYLGLFCIAAIVSLMATNKKSISENVAEPKIQVAILLDVSSSMDGLIDQAKAQLWTMVNTLGKMKCDNAIAPTIEIALYEYGRTNNDAKAGYVKKINGFIKDLDSLSENLFSLKTNGGEEYCGHVIYSSLNELQWDTASNNYKVIFIAGNEDFLQGNVTYTKACSLAKQKGVIVNTIYCGDKQQGIAEHWNLAGECGNGSFSNINQNARAIEIPTPYDSALYVLNDKLNDTYIAYGFDGYAKQSKQGKMDLANTSLSRSAGLKRIQAKSSSKMYNNAQWDLIDAKANDKDAIAKVDKKLLPESLKNKTTAQLDSIVIEKSKERVNAQKEIVALTMQRETFINKEKAKQTNTNVTLETEVEKIVIDQARRFKMEIK
jgi:hypothetical protein